VHFLLELLERVSRTELWFRVQGSTHSGPVPGVVAVWSVGAAFSIFVLNSLLSVFVPESGSST
jgi:hypothetical protein